MTPEEFAAFKLDKAGDLPLFLAGNLKRDKGYSARMRANPGFNLSAFEKDWNKRPRHFPDNSRSARMDAYGLEAGLGMFGLFGAWARWLGSNVKTCREVNCVVAKGGPVHKCAFKHCPRRAHLECRTRLSAHFTRLAM